MKDTTPTGIWVLELRHLEVLKENSATVSPEELGHLKLNFLLQELLCATGFG